MKKIAYLNKIISLFLTVSEQDRQHCNWDYIFMGGGGWLQFSSISI